MKRKPSIKSHKGRSRRTSAKRSAKRTTPWDQAARWYDSLVGSHGSDYHRQVLMPGAFRLLDMKPGVRILDLACGQGVFSRYLNARKIRVEGVDAAQELIRYARSRTSRSVKFHVGDARDPNLLAGEQFDGVVCLLAVQNMEDIDSVFKNVSRLLAPGGKFVLVMTHPCFRIPRQTHWGWDEEKKMEFRRIDLYASETRIPILTPPFADSEDYTWTYHRPISRYFDALSKAGFSVDNLEEWASHKESRPGKRAKAENRARKEIPLFLAVRAIHCAEKN